MDGFPSRFDCHQVLDSDRDVCWKTKRYQHKYPRSFQMRPQQGTSVHSTLYQINPHPLTFVNCDVVHDHWLTTTGLAHDEKIQDRHFQQEILTKAPSSSKMSYIFPFEENRMKKTSRGFNYDPMPFRNTVTKTDYIPVRPIADFDYTGGNLVNITPPRAIRVPKKVIQPGFWADEMFSIFRKFNPYMSSYRIHYYDAPREMRRYDYIKMLEN